ncbi:MAG TPA: histidine kinase [Streptosporangiaceae bacterium]|nr:histidine kinase [Streptosporangiaceae bacterium]
MSAANTVSIAMTEDAHGWARRHQRLLDWALAAALATFSFDQPMPPLLVSVLLAATVVARRPHPVGAFTAAMGLAAVQVVFGLQAGPTDLALVPLLYTLAATRPRRVSSTALAVSLLAAPLALLHWARHYQGPLSAAMIGVGGLAVTTWALGDSLAGRRAYNVALEGRAARLEAERDAQARLAAAAERARELTERRARVVNASDARLHRIERDLHDGAQVRLTALALALGEIKESVEGDRAADERLRDLVAAAHANAKETLAELRDLARGIRPAVLDRGLEPALAVLAQTSPAQVGLTIHLCQRPSPAIEAIAYFCSAELLANVAKHSEARHVAVSVSDAGQGVLVLTVADDGAGRARLVAGGGLDGLRERVQTVDGRLGIDSPAGGPTIVTVELPAHA